MKLMNPSDLSTSHLSSMILTTFRRTCHSVFSKLLFKSTMVAKRWWPWQRHYTQNKVLVQGNYCPVWRKGELYNFVRCLITLYKFMEYDDTSIAPSDVSKCLLSLPPPPLSSPDTPPTTGQGEASRTSAKQRGSVRLQRQDYRSNRAPPPPSSGPTLSKLRPTPRPPSNANIIPPPTPPPAAKSITPRAIPPITQQPRHKMKSYSIQDPRRVSVRKNYFLFIHPTSQ